jgi:hypothetical protein
MKTCKDKKTPEELPRFLTEKEVARMTGLALSTLRNTRFQCRGLPYIKIGRAVRYDLRDVVRFMEAHKIAPREDF